MNIFEIESEREKIFAQIYSHKTPRLLLYNISIYFLKILNSDNRALREVYITEFLTVYKENLQNFEIEGIPIEISELIISTGEKTSKNFKDIELDKILSSLKIKLINLKNILSGAESDIYTGGEISFPVLENILLEGQPIGGLEYVEIIIKQRSDLMENEFVLVPTHLKIDERLEDQIALSWQIALDGSAKYIKLPSVHHEVIVKFKKRFGYYEGNSLGIVLSIAFLKEILKSYNSRYLVLPQPDISATGSLDNNGNTKSLGESIIKNKVEVVFYSSVKNFLIPKEDEWRASEKLKELKIKHPERKISLIGIESLSDVLDRRNIVDIKKENRAIWIYKKSKSNKAPIAVIALSFLIVAYFLFWQFDDKPAILEFQPSTLLVKNEAGNLLWKKEIKTEPITFLSQPIIKKTKSRIVDLKNDGRKEIVTVHELDRGDSLGGLSVFDENGNQLWYSVFSDSVQTKVEKFSSSFTIRSIVDIYNNDEILVIAQHYRYYPSPFIRISSDGKIISGDFWHPGGSMGGFLEDIDDDGKIELVASAISNGLERCVIFSIEYDKLIGTAPTSENYSFLGMQIADFDHYVVLPRTDYNRYFDYRYNTVYPPYINEKKRIGVSLDEDRKSIYLGQGPLVVFNKDFSNPEVVIADDFRSLRDSIVVAGKLNPPLTDTPEYAKILEDQIRYWNGEEFVTHDEYFKK